MSPLVISTPKSDTSIENCARTSGSEPKSMEADKEIGSPVGPSAEPEGSKYASTEALVDVPPP